MKNIHLIINITMIFTLIIIISFSTSINTFPTTSLDIPHNDFFEDKLMPYFRYNDIDKDGLKEMFQIISNEIMAKERELNAKNQIIEQKLVEFNNMNLNSVIRKQHMPDDVVLGVQ